MKPSLKRSILGSICVTTLALSSTAFADEQKPPVSPPPTAPGASVGTAASTGTTAPAAGTAGTAGTAAPGATTPASGAEPEKKEEKKEDEPWYKKIQVGGFVDAYVSINYNIPKPQENANLYHPYNSNAGFGLAWAGLDVSLAPEPVGGTVQLRFGPAVKNLALNDYTAPGNIGNLQNAFLSWKPDGKDGHFTVIGGKFDTLYGAEVAVSHQNINYTRGALYNLAQPFFHTGLRLDGTFGGFTFKVMAVNGWNNTIDNNTGKSFGGQLSYALDDKLLVGLGYLGGPEQVDTVTTQAGTEKVPGANTRWRHLADLVVDAHPTESVRLMLNGTFVADRIVDAAAPGGEKNVSWFGVSAMGRYAFNDMFAAGGRFEFIRDPDGQITAPNTQGMSLVTGTITLEAAPTKYLVFRLDNRVDYATESVFVTTNATSKTQITTTLGLVAKTN
jgi:hypothetical protein